MARIKNLSRFKRTITIPTVEYSNIKRTRIDPRVKYSRQIRAEADVINKMLQALERAGYKDTWASKTLYNKLDTPQIDVIKNGRVDTSKISKTKSMSNLAYIKKALNDFKASKTSTVKGIREREEDERMYIAELTDNQEFADSLSSEEIGNIYEMFNSPDYKKLTESGMYDSLEIFSFVAEAKQEDMGVRKFLQMVKTYSEDNMDYDTRNAFKDIYNKYVKYST